jgi:hypothetical protein
MRVVVVPRRRRKTPPWLLGVGLTGGCALAAAVLIFAAGRLAGPTPGAEGERWTARELAAHLRARGVPAESVPCRGGLVLYPPGDDPAAVQAMVDHQEVVPSGAVVVRRHPDAESARRADADLRWGRFSFRGDPALLRRVAAALP